MRKKTVFEKVVELEKKKTRHGFLIYGGFAPGAEKLARDICQWLEEGTRLPFQGSVRDFSISLPYFTDARAAESFLTRLKESVSIAKDCYEEFCGIILVTFAAEWAKNGVNEALWPVMEYMRSLSRVRYIFLVPEEADRGKVQALLPAFSMVGRWVFAEVEAPDGKAFLKALVQAARKRKYSVSGDVKKALGERIGELCGTDVEKLAEEWLEQIEMNRLLMEDPGRIVLMEDLSSLPGFLPEKKPHGFGFTQRGNS